MGKYIRKAKVTGDVTVMEASQSTLGVRTRAKTLALQRLQSSPAVAPPPPPPPSKPDSCYLELRSRRLEKSPLIVEPKKQAQKAKIDAGGENCCEKSGTGTGSRGLSSGSVGSGSISRAVADRVADDGLDLGVDVEVDEASFGENNLDFEQRERSTRESTPCSFIRDVGGPSTPGSSSRRQSSDAANERPRNSVLRNVPTTHEINEFFAQAEQQQRLLFIEKYNFDIKTDSPLPGRYEWVKVNH